MFCYTALDMFKEVGTEKDSIIENYNRGYCGLFFKFLLKAQTHYHLKWLGRNVI